MNVIEKMMKNRLFEVIFWVLFSFILSCGIYKTIIQEIQRPRSRMESVIATLFITLAVYALLLVFVRRQWITGPCSRGFLAELGQENPVMFQAFLIALPVILFNLVNVFGPHYLLNDDPYRYHQILKGVDLWAAFLRDFELYDLTEGYAWWTMAHYTPYVVRIQYLLLYLLGISFCTYWIARKIFNLPPSCAYLAAVVPAVLPTQSMIIAGINLSYTLIGQLFVMISLILGFSYLARERHSWGLVVMAGLFFTASTSLMEQAMFLSAALGIIYLATSKYILRKVLLLVPVAVSSAVVLFDMIVTPRSAATPKSLSAEVIFGRVKQFFAYISPVEDKYSFLISLILLTAGMVGLLYWSKMKFRISCLPHFAWLPEKLRYWILPGFVFAWTFFSAFPFVSLNSHMNARTIHIAGYGPWLIMAPGICFLLSGCASKDIASEKKRLIVLVILLVVTAAGVEHFNFATEKYSKPNYIRDRISEAVSYHAFPPGCQIVITNARLGTYTSYHTSSGCLTRLLNNRLDIGGIIGKEFFYYDAFSQDNLWITRMTGLKGTGNLRLFRFSDEEDSDQGEYLQAYRYFLQVITGESEIKDGERIGDWYLYKEENPGSFGVKNRGHGIDEYLSLLTVLQEEDIYPADICWGNPEDGFGCNSPMKK